MNETRAMLRGVIGKLQGWLHTQTQINQMKPTRPCSLRKLRLEDRMSRHEENLTLICRKRFSTFS